MCIIIYKIIVARGALLFTGIYTQQDIMRIKILTVGVVAVVGCNYGYIVFFCIFQQCRIDSFQLLDIEPLNFNKEVVAKYVEPPLKLFFGGLFAICEYGLGHMCTNAASCGY